MELVFFNTYNAKESSLSSRRLEKAVIPANIENNAAKNEAPAKLIVFAFIYFNCLISEFTIKNSTCTINYHDHVEASTPPAFVFKDYIIIIAHFMVFSQKV